MRSKSAAEETTVSASGAGSHGLVITCEHGGNRIPDRYRHLFPDHQTLLDTHRGFDPGALDMAKTLASAFDAALVFSTVSRLLVDLNRSVGHPRLYFETVRNASAQLRREVLKCYYQPYREQVEQLIRQAIADHGRVIHISSHSFTPELDGKLRNADIGLLYDPVRSGEIELCARWKSTLKACAPDFKVRRNYPYAGKDDGLTTWLRRQFPPVAYVGVELEINQKLIVQTGLHWNALQKRIVESLDMALTESSDGMPA